ncbi:hypothetical protein Tco_1440699 [Tanacetum coccineum]
MDKKDHPVNSQVRLDRKSSQGLVQTKSTILATDPEMWYVMFRTATGDCRCHAGSFDTRKALLGEYSFPSRVGHPSNKYCGSDLREISNEIKLYVQLDIVKDVPVMEN